ncbi:hypothetical protein [Undibacterium sp.]|uniref:DUF7338 family protein n=1 Tax=Undibacterium sp. TaxID=1914977 RepID=UPI0025D171F3|nr:hypothetical protein [Undibacterium sp.]
MNYLLILAIPLLIYALIAIAGFIYALFRIPSATYQAFKSRGLGVKLVVKWFLLFWVGLVVEVTAFFIGWAVVLFADHQDGRLPYGFTWMETPDALLPGYPNVQGFNTPAPVDWWAWYRQSVCWLARNRAYRFSSEKMGVYLYNNDTVISYGDTSISDNVPIKYGSYVSVGTYCFECEAIFKFAGRVWAIRLGYKMRQVSGKAGYVQHVLRVLCVAKV